MSDVQRVIEIIFTGVDKTGDVMGNIGGGLKDFAGPVAGLGNDVLSLDAALGALAVGGFAVATSMTAKFSDEMLTAKGISGATEAEFKKMTETAEYLGKTTAWTATDAASGLTKFSQAGFLVSESIAALPAALNLATAGGMGVADAVDIASTALKTFHLNASDLQGVGDMLTAAFTGSNSSLNEIGEAFKYVAPIAANMGGEMHDLIAAIGQMHEAGMKGSMAGTALRGSLSTLFNPMGEEKELMKQLGERIGGAGLEVKNADGKFVGFVSIIKQLEKAGIGADEALKLFGDRAGVGMAGLVGLGSASLEKLDKEIINSSAGLGRMAEIAGSKESGLGGAFRSLASATEAVMLSLGTSVDIAPGVRGLVEIFREFSDIIKSGGFSDFTKPIKDGIVAVDSAFREVAKNLPEAFGNINFDGLLEGFGSLGIEIKGIFESFAGDNITSVNGLTNVFQNIVDALTTLVNVTEGMAEVWEPVLAGIASAVEWFTTLDKATQEAIGNILGIAQQIVIFGGLLATGGAMVSGLAAIGGGLAALGGGIASLVGVLTGPVGLVIAVGAAATAVGTLINTSETVQKTTQGIIGALDGIFNFTNSPTNIELAKIDENFQKARQQAQETAAKVKESFSEMGESVKEGWSLDEFKLQFDTTSVQDFKEQIGEAKQIIKEFADGVREVAPDDVFVMMYDFQAKGGAIAELGKLKDMILDFQDIKEEEIELKLNLPSAEEQAQINTLRTDLTGIYAEIERLSENGQRIKLGYDEGSKEDIEKINAQIDYLKANASGIELALKGKEEVSRDLDDLITEKHLLIFASADKDSIENTKGFITEKVGDHTVITMKPEIPEPFKEKLYNEIEVIAKDGSKTIVYEPIWKPGNIQEDIEKEIPKEKLLEIKTKLDIEQLKADTELAVETIKTASETIQTQIEWKAKLDIATVESNTEIIKSKVEWEAKLDIANVEANVEKIKAAMQNVSEMFDSTGKLLATIYGEINKNEEGSLTWQMMWDAAQREEYRRDKTLEMQQELQRATIEQMEQEVKDMEQKRETEKELNEMQQDLLTAQKEFLNTKTEMLKNGDFPLIKVEADGLVPQLEIIWMEILQALQVRVNEEGAEMLIGLAGLT